MPTETQTPPEPSFLDAVTEDASKLDFSKIYSPASPAEAPPAQPKPPESPKPAAPAPSTPPPAGEKKPLVAPLKPAKPAAPAEADPEPPPSIKSTKAADDWKKIHNEAKTLREKLAAAESKLSQFTEAKPSPELERLKKREQELSEQLRITDVERHPDFKNYFGSKIETAVGIAKKAVGADKAEQIARILMMPDSDYRTDQLEAFVAELSDARRSKVLTADMELARVNAEREQAIAKAHQDREGQEQNRAREMQARNAQLRQVFDARLKDAQEGLAAFQEREGDDEWNAGVRERVELAKRFYAGELPIEDVATVALWAAGAPALNEEAVRLSERVKELEEENASLRAASPSPSGGGDTPPPEEDKEMSFLDRVDKQARARESEIFGNRGWK